MHLIQLLICCYMEISLLVINIARLEILPVDLVLLRFHRNNRAEDLVDQVFAMQLRRLFSDPNYRPNYKKYIKSYRMALFKELLISSSRPLFLCFDEIQLLIGKCSDQFLSEECYQRMEKDDFQSEDFAQKRDLFYGTFSVMSDFMMT